MSIQKNNHPMDLKERIKVFSDLGIKLKNLSHTAVDNLTLEAKNKNPWFTPKNVRIALEGVITLLQKKHLEQWTSHYNFSPCVAKTIGVVMAGNIPLAGFYDLLNVLISGNILQAKLSTQDSILPVYIKKELIKLEPRFANKIYFTTHLKNYDAVIATGSTNTSRYFEYYFKNIPHIIRKNRSACAVLSGKETTEELEKLGKDVFFYFGLGCRSVSKLYVPKGYDFSPLLHAWGKYDDFTGHHKYANNYDYNKSIFFISQQAFITNGTVLLVENKELISPISVIHYEWYDGQKNLKSKIDEHKTQLQCVIGCQDILPSAIPFGKAQYPSVWDYPDGINILKFISSLN